MKGPTARTRILAAALGAACALAPACGRGPAAPGSSEMVLGQPCQSCRMIVGNALTAAQIAAPMEEPIVFDDIGCLRDYLGDGGRVPPRAVAFVADHRTGLWVRASVAVYTRAHEVDTPMGSHLIAHADAASRQADPDAAGGTQVTAGKLFGQGGAPDGRESAGKEQ